MWRGIPFGSAQGRLCPRGVEGRADSPVRELWTRDASTPSAILRNDSTVLRQLRALTRDDIIVICKL